MCLVKGIIKCLLGIVVGVILTAGLILMAVGGILLWGMNSVMPKLYDVTGAIKTMLKNLSLSEEGVKSVETMISANSATLGAIAFTVGVIFTAIAILGYISLCCLGMQCFFIVIIVIISSLLVALIVVAIVYGSSGNKKVMDEVEKQLYKLVEKYEGDNATNVESLIVNVVQSQANCCGIYNYTDFNASTNWEGKKLNYKFPLSCCEFRDFKYVDVNKCKSTWTSPALATGCYARIKPTVEQVVGYAFMSLGISIGILALLDLMFILFLLCERKVSK